MQVSDNRRLGGMNRRMVNGVGALICGALLVFALYSEHILGLEPCPLCVFQRVAVLALGFVFLAAYAHNPRPLGAKLYGVLVILAGGAGIVFAGRQLWLQSLPEEQVPECGPGLEFIMDVFPFWEAVTMVFRGSGDCAEVDWSLFGISMAGWVLMALVALVSLSTWNNFRR